MAALTAARDTHSRGVTRTLGPLTVQDAVVIYRGALLMLNPSTGEILPGATATGQIALGRAPKTVDNTDDGLTSEVEQGVFKWGNSAAADEIDDTDIGALCYIVDDQTVAATNGTSTRSAAGRVVGVDSDGVWVLTAVEGL